MAKKSKSKSSRKNTKLGDFMLPPPVLPPPPPKKGMSLRAKLAIVIIVGIIIGVSVWAGTRPKPEDPADPPIDGGTGGDGTGGDGTGGDGTGGDGTGGDGTGGDDTGGDGTGGDDTKKKPVGGSGSGGVGAIVGGVAVFIAMIGGIVVLTHKESIATTVANMKKRLLSQLESLKKRLEKRDYGTEAGGEKKAVAEAQEDFIAMGAHLTEAAAGTQRHMETIAEETTEELEEIAKTAENEI